MEHVIEHKKIVSDLLDVFCQMLKRRAVEHDNSKLTSPEREGFAKSLANNGNNHPYESTDYAKAIIDISEAVLHHHANNPHHPEYHADGIAGMNLIDLMEMFADWFAAAQQNTNGDICRSIYLGSERFKMSEQLTAIFENTKKLLI